MTELAAEVAERHARAKRRGTLPADSEPASTRQSRNPPASPGRTVRPKRASGKGFQLKAPTGPHSGALFAEYFCAALIIVLALFTETQTKGYTATISKVMTRLTALTMVFFVLFLLQGSKRGSQFAIWLGLLIDIGVIYTAAQESLFSTVSQEVSGKGVTGVTLDDSGKLVGGGGVGIDPPPEPVGVTLPSE